MLLIGYIDDKLMEIVKIYLIITFLLVRKQNLMRIYHKVDYNNVELAGGKEGFR